MIYIIIYCVPGLTTKISNFVSFSLIFLPCYLILLPFVDPVRYEIGFVLKQKGKYMVIFFQEFWFTSQSRVATVKVQLKDVKSIAMLTGVTERKGENRSRSFHSITMNIKQPRHDKI